MDKISEVYRKYWQILNENYINLYRTIKIYMRRTGKDSKYIID